MYIYFKKLGIPVLVLTIILACAPFAAATPQPAATLNALYTSAAQTLDAMSTQGSYTATVQPFATVTLSLNSATPFATYTTVPQLQTVVNRCDAASFVSDVTYPDGSTVARGSTFTKIWRVKNTGTCTWNTSYTLVYVSGEKFSAPNSVTVPGNVGPGQSVDIPVNLTAPNNPGNYTGYWRLRNASGVLFGVGNNDASIYVDVNVTGYTVTGYDLLASYCEAAWRNTSQDLPCPGNQGDDRGFVQRLNSPELEDGKSRGDGLLTYPEKGSNGVITAKYPGLTIQSGDRFQALIGCLEEANDCDLVFRVQYQIGNGDIKTLGQWREVYEGEQYPVNIDLSFLNGEKVKFILSVLANGNSHEDFAVWVAPRITRQSSQPPTATYTPSATATPTGSATATATVTATSTATNTPTSTPTNTPTGTLTP